MFSLPVLPYSNPQANQHQHLPIISSPLSSSPTRPPLSPRNANLRTHSMSSPPRSKPSEWNTSPSSASTKSDYAKRLVKSNPLMERKGGDDGRETRRKLFLKRVREESENKRWEARGGDDEIMRVIWIGEERRRAERRAREAQSVVEEEEDSELDRGVDADEDMVDEAATQEIAELEAYFAMMEAQSQHRSESSVDAGSTDGVYGSDDDDYDSLFIEVINDEARYGLPQSKTTAPNELDDMMDTS